MIKYIAKRLPFFKKVFEEREAFRKEKNELRIALNNLRMYRDPDHFYSPLSCLKDIETHQADIFSEPPAILPGIDLYLEAQKSLLKHFKSFYQEQPFPEQKTDGQRYFLSNPNFSYSDGIFLYCMMRYLKPSRMIEVGSGYSSCAILDVNALFFNNSIECKFIEPYPDLFLSLISEQDKKGLNLINTPLQKVDESLFRILKENDILFIDSSHVSKIGSDVNHIFFKILPLLQKGVMVHFHDICYPFEYPKSWVLEGRAWNEAYLMRAFLEYNNEFSIDLFNSYLSCFNHIPKEMALCIKGPGSGLWLRKK